MLDRITLLNGALNFTIMGFVIDFILLSHFCLSWYVYYKRHNNFVSYWHFFLLIPLVIPTFLIYPFSASINNYVSTGQTYFLIEKNIDKAFLITSLGYVSLCIGKYLFLHFKEKNIFAIILPLGDGFRKIIYTNIRNIYSLCTLFLISISLIGVIIIVQIKAGYIFDPRSYFFQDGRIRPFFNLSNIISTIAILYIGINVIDYKKRVMIAFFVLLLIGTLFLGGRGGLINPIITLLVFYNLKTNRLNFVKVSLIAVILTILALYLGELRNGIYNISYVFTDAMNLLLYGNNLSDVRDFAWILSYWDGHYVLGNTYIAAFMSFIPRFLSSFRDNWALSVYTDKLVGFPTEHPGLRPGLFGESFLNFGLPGVVVIGLFCGYLLAFVDFKARTLSTIDLKRSYSYTIYSIFISNLLITAGFFYIYVFIFINLFLFVISILTNKRKYFSHLVVKNEKNLY